MTKFQKLIVLFLFVITISANYYFFIFLPGRERIEQKRIEQIKVDCSKDLRIKLRILEEVYKAESVPYTKEALSLSERNYVYNLCLRQHGL